jgi:hypothetical protein
MNKTLTNILKSLEGKTINEMYLFLRDTLSLNLKETKKIINLKTGINIITFDDLEFSPHPLGDGIMSSGRINDKKYSIISGSRFYSTGEGLNYEVYNEGMEEPEGWLDEEGVTELLLNLY